MKAQPTGKSNLMTRWILEGNRITLPQLTEA